MCRKLIHGDTLEEALANGTDALQAALSLYVDRMAEIPQPMAAGKQ